MESFGLLHQVIGPKRLSEKAEAACFWVQAGLARRGEGATGLDVKTLRAAVLLAVGFVGSFLTARSGDARNSPPRPQPKSPAAGHLRFFRQSLRILGDFMYNPFKRSSSL